MTIVITILITAYIMSAWTVALAVLLSVLTEDIPLDWVQVAFCMWTPMLNTVLAIPLGHMMMVDLINWAKR